MKDLRYSQRDLEEEEQILFYFHHSLNYDL